MVSATFQLSGSIAPPCPEGLHRCDDGQCVDPDARCNGRVQCRDGSDESNCRKLLVFIVTLKDVFPLYCDDQICLGRKVWTGMTNLSVKPLAFSKRLEILTLEVIIRV